MALRDPIRSARSSCACNRIGRWLCAQLATASLVPRMATTSTSTPLLSERELRAWRGMLRVHAKLVKALDAELVAGHGLGITSYEVLLFLADSSAGKMRM